MADNLSITAGSGTTIATDDVGGVHYQKVKLVNGTADDATAIPGGANGLRVQTNTDAATLVKKTVDFAANATAQTVWDPTGGTKFVICDIVVSASAAGALTLFDETDDAANRIAKFNFAANGGAVINYRKPVISATADNILKYTTGAVIAGSITVSGYEV